MKKKKKKMMMMIVGSYNIPAKIRYLKVMFCSGQSGIREELKYLDG